MTTFLSDRIDTYFSKGYFHKDWYEDEANKLKQLLPEFEGLPIIRVFAVTSMTTNIEANVHLALKALLLWKKGLPFKGFLPNQILYLNQIKEGKDVKGRKIMTFIRALEGDENAVVVDIWMCRAFGVLNARILPNGRPYFKAPSKKDYDYVEKYVRQDCIKRGVTPRQYQSIV